MKSNLDKKLIGSLSLADVIHFVIAVVVFAAISWIYFYPNDVNGDILQQNDIMQGVANGQETKVMLEQTGEKSWWTDALFGGMPTFQIAPSYQGTNFLKPAEALYRLYFPTPVSWIFLLMLSFFLLMLAFKVRWYYAVLGAIGYAFSSYFFILMGAGHIWKLMTLVYIPPTLAGIVWCYRGKYLGDSVTTEQWDEINAGTFNGLYIGDYWTINSVNWRIAAFDYWLNSGDTNCTKHHVVIVPDTNLATCQMNSTNITTGAYTGSDFYTGNNSNTGFATAKSVVNSAFGSTHVLKHRILLKNAVSNGYASGYIWTDSTVDLMSEKMVYGTQIYSAMPNGSTIPSQYTVDKTQLPLFALEPSRISNRSHWWLRSVVSASAFAYVSGRGVASTNNASNSYGVRPAFGIVKS